MFEDIPLQKLTPAIAQKVVEAIRKMSDAKTCAQYYDAIFSHETPDMRENEIKRLRRNFDEVMQLENKTAFSFDTHEMDMIKHACHREGISFNMIDFGEYYEEQLLGGYYWLDIGTLRDMAKSEPELPARRR